MSAVQFMSRSLIGICFFSLLLAGCTNAENTGSANANNSDKASTGTFEDNVFLADGIKKALFEDCSNIPKKLKQVTPMFVDYWFLNEDWKVFEYGESYMLVSPAGSFGPDIEDSFQISLHDEWGCEGTEHYIAGFIPNQDGQMEPETESEFEPPFIGLTALSGECYRFSLFRGCRIDFVIENYSSGPIQIFGNIYAVVDGQIYLAETSRTSEVLYIEGFLNPNDYYKESAYFDLSEGQFIESIHFGPVPEVELADASWDIRLEVDYDLEWGNP